MNSSQDNYIVNTKHLISEPLPATESSDFNSSLYSNLKNWTLPILSSPTIKYHFINDLAMPAPTVSEYNNEYNLPEEDKTTLADKIEPKVIDQFLRLKEVPFTSDITYDINSVFSVTDYRPAPEPSVTIPETFDNVFYTYISVSLQPIGQHGTAEPLSNYTGMLFVYNIQTKMPLTEAAYFKYQLGKIEFSKTNTGSVIFKIPKSEKNILLVSVLMHPDAGKPNTFLANCCPGNHQRVDNHMVHVPFAYSTVYPYTTTPETNFNFAWTLLNEQDLLGKISLSPGPDETSISLISKVTIHELEYYELEGFGTYDHPDEQYPYMCFPAQSQIFSKLPMITISNISFTFNNIPKAFLVFFKVYFCEDITNVTDPYGMVGFVQQTENGLTNCYQSCYMQPAKKIVFPDIVRFQFSRPLGPRSHFVVQFVVLGSEREPMIYKCGIIELFQNGPVEFDLQTYNTMQPKKLQGQYLSRPRPTTHSNIQCIVDLPPAFYPPPAFVTLSESIMASQINWNQVKSTPRMILKRQVLPTIVKLLSLLSQQTLEQILDLIATFNDDKGVKDIVRSYIFNNFKTNTKPNFFTTFVTTLDQLLQEGLEQNSEVLKNLCCSFDIVASLIVVSFEQKIETQIPQQLLSLFIKFTNIFAKMIENKTDFNLNEVVLKFGWLTYHFCSLLDARSMTIIINYHLRTMMAIKDSYQAMMAVFEFLIPFTRTPDFVRYFATRIPVRPLSEKLMSPFQPTLSLIFLCISQAFGMQNDKLITTAVNFIARLTLPLETVEDGRDRFRVGYALFPLFDLLTVAYDTVFSEEDRHLLVPTILFLLSYIPRGLMRTFFKTVNVTFRERILSFLYVVVKSCIEQLSETVTVYNSQLNEMTKRMLMFVATNLNEFSECIGSACSLLSLLATTPHQIPRNYPRLFSAIAGIIEKYPRQRQLMTDLLSMITMKLHIARCFATTLILLFFKSDYDTRNSITISSAEVLDVLTSLMLTQPAQCIPLYQLMLERISDYSRIFQNRDFYDRMIEKLDSAKKLADVIKSMRNSSHSPAEKCEYVMQIANQYNTYPSMRLKWLSELVSINKQNNFYSAAFVAQLHKCALISTVIEHERKLKGELNDIPLPREHNLLVTQPITMSKATIGRDIMLFDRDFEFIPSVMVETKIDFKSVSDAFKFLAGDFTIDLFKKAIDEAIEYGTKVKALYSLRCLRSIQLRIYASSKQYSELSQICTTISGILKEIPVTDSAEYDIPYIFTVHNNTMWCYDAGTERVNGIRVYPHDTNDGQSFEFKHAWNVFRTKVTPKELENVRDSENKSIFMARYITEQPLPRFTPTARIIDTKDIKITLNEYVNIEKDRLCRLMDITADDFERCFPTRNIDAIFGRMKQNIEGDLSRVVWLIKAALQSDYSLFWLFKLLEQKGNKSAAVEYAQQTLQHLQRLVKVYHRAIEYLESVEHFSIYTELQKARNEFLQHFELPDIDTKSYEGRRDPIMDKYEFEQ